MKVELNAKVSIVYSLYLDDKKGELVETVDPKDPFDVVIGAGELLDSFEKKLFGLKKGEKFEIYIPCEEAYGHFDQDAIVEVEKSIFEVDGVIKEDVLFQGSVIPLNDQHGNLLHGEILEVDGDKIKIDLNHPLTEENLYFVGYIKDIQLLN